MNPYRENCRKTISITVRKLFLRPGIYVSIMHNEINNFIKEQEATGRVYKKHHNDSAIRGWRKHFVYFFEFEEVIDANLYPFRKNKEYESV